MCHLTKFELRSIVNYMEGAVVISGVHRSAWLFLGSSTLRNSKICIMGLNSTVTHAQYVVVAIDYFTFSPTTFGNSC